MFFFIRTADKPGQPELRQRIEAEHRAWLDSKAGAIVAAGAILQDDGSDAGGGVYLVEAQDCAGAEAFIHADPFFKAGLFAQVEVLRWRKAYVDGKNLLLHPSASQPAPARVET